MDYMVEHHSEYDYDDLVHHHSEYDYDDMVDHYIEHGSHTDDMEEMMATTRTTMTTCRIKKRRAMSTVP